MKNTKGVTQKERAGSAEGPEQGSSSLGGICFAFAEMVHRVALDFENWSQELDFVPMVPCQSSLGKAGTYPLVNTPRQSELPRKCGTRLPGHDQKLGRDSGSYQASVCRLLRFQRPTQRVGMKVFPSQDTNKPLVESSASGDALTKG